MAGWQPQTDSRRSPARSRTSRALCLLQFILLHFPSSAAPPTLSLPVALPLTLLRPLSLVGPLPSYSISNTSVQLAPKLESPSRPVLLSHSLVSSYASSSLKVSKSLLQPFHFISLPYSLVTALVLSPSGAQLYFLHSITTLFHLYL